MNKHLFRIVFNHALGVLQVVAEIARRPGGGNASGGRPAAAALRPVSFALWLALGWVGVVAPLQAQQVYGERHGRIVPDREAPGAHRPTVLESSNGVPVVNITTPSEAGVSRNIYSQFDVGEQGAILNNARTAAQTQLGGWIDGNPYLATGTARIILNEVNSSNPSHLNGYIEVGGDRAQIVIANPAGLHIDGGGFLNASGVTLTTGKPILENGALAGYRVERGTIGVSGRGMDATGADYTALLARSMEINAGVWAQQLQVTAGANTISADHAQVAALEGAGAAPALALDVGALGGMYANKIWLVGTEHGLGVRNAGEIGAQAGELVVNVDGRLENTGKLQSRTDTLIQAAGGVTNAGTMSAARELTVTTSGEVDNSGGMINARRVELEAAALRNRDGAIEQTGSQVLALHAGYLTNRDGGRVGMAGLAGGGEEGGGQHPGGGDTGTPGGDHGKPGAGDGDGTGGGELPMPGPLADGALRIAGTLDNDGGVINAGGGVELVTAGGLDNSGGQIGLERLTLEQGYLGNTGGELNIRGDASLTVDEVHNDQGMLAVGGALQIDARAVSNREGTLSQGDSGASSFKVAGTLDNTGGTLASNASAWSIHSGVLVNEHGLIEHAGTEGLFLQAGSFAGAGGQVAAAGEVRLEGGDIDHRGATLGATRISVHAGQLDNRGGDIVASGEEASSFDVSGHLDNSDGGRIAGRGDLKLRAAHLGNATGTLQHAGAGELVIEAGVLSGAHGTIASNGSLRISGGHIDLQHATTHAAEVVIDSDGLVTVDGSLVATGDGPLQLQVAGTLDNDRGTIATNGALDLSAGGLHSRGGLLQAAGGDSSRLAVAGTFDNAGGTLATAGDTYIRAARLDNAAGAIQAAAGAGLSIDVDGILDNRNEGLLAAEGDMVVAVGTLDNAGGQIAHAGEGSLAIAATSLDGAGGTIAGNGALTISGIHTDLRGASTQAESIRIDTGSLTTAGGELVATGDGVLRVDVADTFDNHGGLVATAGALEVSAGGLDNREGLLQATGAAPTRVQVSRALDNTGGTLVAAGDTAIRTTDLINVGGVVHAAAGASLQVTATGLIDNHGEGLIAAAGDMALAADRLDNTGGILQHAGEGVLTIDAGTLDGHGGTIAGNGELVISGESLDLRSGTTSAEQIDIQATDLTTAEGALIATGEGPLQIELSGVLDNDSGTIATNGALDLHVATLINRSGTLQAAGSDPTRVQVAGTFDNTGGALATGGDTSIRASTLLNTGGSVQAVDAAALQVMVDGLLENRDDGLLAAGGDMRLAAGVLDNTAGAIAHSGSGELAIEAATLAGAGGSIAGNGRLMITGQSTHLAGGSTSAESITITTGDLVTADGQLVATGEGPLQLQVQGVLDNDRGTVATNGALDLAAGSIRNREGTLQAAGRGPSQLLVSGTFDNSSGGVVTGGDSTITAGELLNAGGAVQAAGESSLTVEVDGHLDNRGEGLIASAGDMAISAGTLDNTAGAIQHAGEGVLSIDVAGALDGATGSLVSNGTLALTGGDVDLSGGTTAAQRITLDAGALSTAHGTLVASGTDALELRISETFDNTGGNVATNGALDLSAGGILNRDGILQAAGDAASRVAVAGAFDNTAGVLATAGDTVLTAGALYNAGGSVFATGTSTLQVRVDGLLDNRDEGLLAASGDMQLSAGRLDNTAGQIQHSGDGALAIDATVLDGAGGTIAGNGSLAITGTTIDLRGGTTSAESIAIDTVDLTTAEGTLLATGEGVLALEVAGTLDNEAGTIATNGALALEAGVLGNRGGTLQAAGSDASHALVADTFDNAGGILATAGDTFVAAHELHNAGGTLLAADASTLQVQVDGLLDNSDDGVVSAGGDLALMAATLDNRAGRIEHAGEGRLDLEVVRLDGAGGTIASEGALDLAGDAIDLRGATTIARQVAIDAGSLVTAEGSLVATGNEVLDLHVRDGLDNTAGTIATNGALDLSAGSVRNAAGLIQAAGSDPTRVQVAGRFDNTGGELVAAGATTVQAGELVNIDGVLQSASDAAFRISSDGGLLNDGGVIAGNGDIVLHAGAMTNRDGVVQTQQAIEANVAGTLDNTRGALVAGGDLFVHAGSLLNLDTAEGGLSGEAVTLEADLLDNSGGRIVAGDGLAITATDLVNTAGVIDGTGAVTLDSVTLDNTSGALVQRGDGNLIVDVASAVTNNAGGLVGAEGALTLSAGVLDNTGGTVFARHDLDIDADGQLLNRDGGLLQTGADMRLQADGAFDNRSGTVDATGSADVVAGSINNAGGQLLAGTEGDTASVLTLTTPGALDNRGGSAGSRGGDFLVDSASIDNRGDGVLVAGRDITLGTTAVDNSGGTVYATRDLRYENPAGRLANVGGQFGAGETAWLDLASIDNRDGGLIRAGTLWLETPQLHNDGGEVAADVLHAQIDAMTGAGRVYGAQWLDLVFSGDFTYLDGTAFESGGRLDLTVHGTFTNQGTLQSASELNLVADDLVNEGTINASNTEGTGVTRISADGLVDNRTGASIEGDLVELTADDVRNTGDIIGNEVAIDAGTLTNGRDLGSGEAARDYGEGFIGAAEYLELRIGDRLSNLDAEIFSGGDLVIAGRVDGTATTLLENVSGRIQAEDDLFVAATTIENRRRLLEYMTRALTPEEQEEMRYTTGWGSDADTYREAYQKLYDDYCWEDLRTHCQSFEMWSYHEQATPTEGLFVTRASAAAQFLSGGDMTLQTTALRNRYSAIAAGGSLFINGSVDGDQAPGVLNESLSAEQAWLLSADYHLAYQRCQKDLTCHYEPREDTDTLEFGEVIRTFHPEEGQATITAGDTLVIVSDGDVSNTVVNVSGAGSINAGGVAGPASTGLGQAEQASAGAVETVGPAAGGPGPSEGVVAGIQTDAVDGRGPVSAVDGHSATGGDTVDAADGSTVETGGSVATVTADVGGAGTDWVEAADRSVNGPGNPANAAPQLVGTPEQPLPGLVPADNGMFDLDADPDAPFLVTTAPRFVPDNTIGSDYLTGLLGHGSNPHKRLGDAYYEQRLVLEQLLSLTGRRSLDGSDALTQYRSLMDNAAQTAESLGLVLGSPLTAVQIAALDSDIVWLVEQEIDGVTVLVPVVYLSRATAERLRVDGALIAGDTVHIDSAATVRNDGTMTAGQGMWLSAGTLINDGALSGGQQLAISTAADTLNRGTLSADAVTIDAGRDVINAVQQGVAGTRGGVIEAGEGGLRIDAGRDVIHQGSIASAGHAAVTAGRDLQLDAAQISADGHLVLDAGRDLSVTAQTSTRTDTLGHTTYTRETLDASQLQAGGHLVLQSGRDTTLEAAQLEAGEAVAIAAGRDLALTTVTTTDTSLTDIDWGRYKRHTETADETVHGTSVQAGGDIALSAGRDATLTAAQVTSDDGGIAIAAGRDLTLAAAEETHEFEEDTYRKKSGFLSSKTTTTHTEVTQAYAVGTTLSGETVDLAAGNDLTLQAATVAGTGDVRLVAGNDINIEAAQNTTTESHDSQTRKSGVFGSGGIGFTIGSQRVGNTADITETTHTGSLVGSTDGRVDIVAGDDVSILGSDVLSREGIAISGENVTIAHVEDTLSVAEGQSFKQGGINVSLRGGAVDTATAVYGATRRADEVEDDRLKALYAARAGQALFSGGQAGLNNLANTGQQVSDLASTDHSEAPASGNSGLSLRIGIGASRSSGETHYQETTVTGSRIASEGDVAIVARSGDLSVTGSQVEGDNVALAAARDLVLQSAQESHAMDARDRASSGEIGITMGTEAGIGVYVSAHAARGDGEGSGTSHTETTVQAGDTLTLVSGRDTTLEGAQAIGKTVLADVGRNLTLTSQQDTNDYDREDKAGGIDVAVGLGGGSASGYYNQSDIESAYRSVNEQTGIQAGAGGFDITVGGHTELTGAAIASTADPALNRLSTDSLAASDLANHAEYDASSFGVSAGGGSSGGGWSGGASPSLGIRQSESGSSTTRSGISDGVLEIRGGDESALANLDRDLTELQRSGLGEIFDEQKVAERMEMGQVAGEVGFRAAGDIAGRLGWAEGSPQRVALHGAVGAAMSALGGAGATEGLTGAVANQLAFNAARDYLTGSLGLDEGSAAFNAIMELASLAVGAAVSGEPGAATALSATQNNYLTHQQIEMLQAELGECELAGNCDAVVRKYTELSQAQDEALLQTCATAPSGSACQDGIRQALNYAGDTSWKSYEVRLGLDRESGRIPFDQMDVDIERARSVALDITLSSRTTYGAIADIESRADFFGAMRQATGAVWFGVAENTSRTQLQGPEYDVGSTLTGVAAALPFSWLGTTTLDQWRDAAGLQIMDSGYDNFMEAYTQPWLDMNEWSKRQLSTEQHDPGLQDIHERHVPGFPFGVKEIIEWRGGVDDLLDPEERVRTGCRLMGFAEDCGD